MARLIDEARARGERAMVLEVIQQNEPAVRLYTKCGFRTVRRLVGYVASPPHDGDSRRAEQAALVEIDVRELARQVSVRPARPALADPGESLAQMGPPNVAYRLERRVRPPLRPGRVPGRRARAVGRPPGAAAGTGHTPAAGAAGPPSAENVARARALPRGGGRPL